VRGEYLEVPGLQIDGSPSGPVPRSSHETRGEWPEQAVRTLGGKAEGSAMSRSGWTTPAKKFGDEVNLHSHARLVASEEVSMTVLHNASLVAHERGRDRAVVPYLTGGVGGVTLLSRADLGLVEDDQYLAGNGLEFSLGRWGVRGDYRRSDLLKGNEEQT
jgi:hypothetical protein